jgi:hypothetical protein
MLESNLKRLKNTGRKLSEARASKTAKQRDTRA